MKWLAFIVLLGGCKISSLIYQCSSDTQCSGSGGRCVGGSCAFPSSSCATGLVFDPSATSGLGGQCVTADQLNDSDLAMADDDMGDGTVGDMAGPSPDLWMPPCVWTATNNLPENGARIWAADASHLAVAGQTNLLVSNTSGLGWTGVQLRDVANTVLTPRALFSTGSTFWAIGNGMNVWSIDDNTNTVTLDYHPATMNSVDISGIWGASAADLWTIGDSAVPIHRVGTTWTLASSSAAMGNDMFSMHGSSATNVWAAGDFYVTHWDGNSWTPQMLNVGSGAINSIWTRDSMNAYIVTGGNYYATHDGGANWGGGATGLTTGLAIYGFPGHLYVAGNGYKVAHSIDDGAHWTLEDVGFPVATPNISHVSGRSAHEVYVVAGMWWSICK